MIRILVFILSVFFLAFMVTWLAGMESRFAAEIFGSKVSMPSGLVIGGLFAGAALLIYSTHLVKKIMAAPGKLKAKEREARRARGVTALTRGLEAVAVGDASDAQHHAKVARRNLDDQALTRLLTAQAAHLAGDDATASASFAAMLEAPETEFIGLRGMYAKAMRDSDSVAARDYAERAFKLRPNATWAFEALFEMALGQGAWGQARQLIAAAMKHKTLAPERAMRAEAVLLTADATAAAASNDEKMALGEVRAALKLAPGFAPAAVLGAKLHNDEGRRERGAKLLEQAFTVFAHPILTDAHFHLYTDEAPEKRIEKIERLVACNPQSHEARLQMARARILAGEPQDAVTLLEPLLAETAGARECALMADAVSGAYDAQAARPWLERASSAPRESLLAGDGVVQLTREGWARLVREYMDYERLAPPPIEAPRTLSGDEIKLLAAPLVEEQTIPNSQQEDDHDKSDPHDAVIVTPDSIDPGDQQLMNTEDAETSGSPSDKNEETERDPSDAAIAAARNVS